MRLCINVKPGASRFPKAPWILEVGQDIFLGPPPEQHCEFTFTWPKEEDKDESSSLESNEILNGGIPCSRPLFSVSS